MLGLVSWLPDGYLEQLWGFYWDGESLKSCVNQLSFNLFLDFGRKIFNWFWAWRVRQVLIGFFGPVSIWKLIIFFLVVLNVKQHWFFLFNRLRIRPRLVFLNHFAYSQLCFDLLGLDIPLENNSQPDFRLSRYKDLSHVVYQCQEHLWESVKKACLEREAPPLLLDKTRISFFVSIFNDV